ncbi:nitroreductase family protein [Chloroflexota bacterium]
MASLLVDGEKCNKCGMCAAECPICIIQMVEKETPPSWADDAEALCINCGHCVAVCPTGALGLSTMPLKKCVPITKNLKTTPEQLEQFLKSRRSIRAYKKKPVEHEKLAKLIDIARYAPSGHNQQPVQWLVVEKRKDVKQLAQMTIDWLRGLIKKDPTFSEMVQAEALVAGWDSGIDVVTRGAPHLIFAHAQKDSVPLGDCHIALTYLELAAHSMGVGACWGGFVQVGATYDPALAQALQLPEGHASFGAMMIGYPKYKFSRIPVRNDAQVIWR